MQPAEITGPEHRVCPFCALVEGRTEGDPQRSDIVARTADALVLVSPRWWPRNRGHLLVVTRRHTENLYTAVPDELHALVDLARTAAIVLKDVDGCEGTSLRQHNEPAGGQDVFHLHLHVFPRWAGDDLYRSDPDPGFAPAGARAVRAAALAAHPGWPGASGAVSDER